MGDPSASDSRPCHFWRIGRLACGVAAAIALIAAIPVGSSAQLPPPAGTTPNPNLAVRCGLKVNLVLDESQSISAGNNGFDVVDVVRDAATGFVTALEDTGSPVGLTAFHSFARPGPPTTEKPDVGYSEVTRANLSMFTDWIGTGKGPNPGGYDPPTTVSTFNGGTGPSGTTNWQDGFEQVNRTPGGLPNLVVFVTDGDPNTVGTGNPVGQPTGNDQGTGRPFYIGHDEGSFQRATGPAVTVANALKGEGVRIFAIGVGPAVTTQGSPSIARLQRISGSNEGTNPITADYALVSSFTGLRAELVGIVASLCGSSLIIHKHVADVHGGPWMRGQGWTFTANLTSHGHTWLTPASAGTHNSATLTTDSNGRLEFAWRLPEADRTAHLGVTKETVKPGLHFVEAVCETHNLEGHVFDDTVTTMLPIPGATLGREEYRTCNVYNSPEKPGNGGGDSEAPDLVIPAHAPHLAVHKHMPAHAHVGDRIPITITVKNVGKGTAKDVVLHESRLGGLTIVAVADHGSLQHDGSALWHLGNLAPGHTVTVHATALVTHTGLHPDTAVASASNADPAFSNARVRAAAVTRPPTPTTPPTAPAPAPPFTG